ncbi:MAG: murein transglycosylase [Alphaproteobacteria bacterium]|nr:murein transglycosylase [Alphaproteobacteria bacterium]
MSLLSKFLTILSVCLLFGCTVPQNKSFAVKAVSYSSLPNWKNDNFQEVLPALQANCQALENDSEWDTFCSGIKRLENASSKQIRKFIENTMTPYAVYTYGKRQGTFTGYYEASLNGALKQDDRYKYPIYGIPNDLIILDTKTVCTANGDTGTQVGRIENKKFIPYFTREEINKKGLDAPIILWVDNPVDAFILHIQGSGRVETEDGVFHIGYAANNGHQFIGIGSVLKEAGVLESGKSSMPEIRKWLNENPEQAMEYMNKNPRYIFFKITGQADGPLGALGVPLTAKRSMAVDKKYIPLGTLLYLDTSDAQGNEIKKLVVAQDVGGAIKGAVRGDFFWGYGEEAFHSAGKMKSQGTYYMLLPKSKKVPKPF